MIQLFEKKTIKFDDFILESLDSQIKHAHVSKEIKELMQKYKNTGSRLNKSRLFGIRKPSEFNKKIKDEKLPDGYSMGIDKNGFFIYTHRYRSKSYEDFMKIPKKDIEFVDSTG